MRNSKILLCLLVLSPAAYVAHCGLDSVSPTAFQVGVTADLTVKATADSRSGTWQVKVTSIPNGWTINSGIPWPVPGWDVVPRNLNAGQQGSFIFKATPGGSAVDGDLAFELWYDRGLFAGGWQKVDGPRSWRLTVLDNQAPEVVGVEDRPAGPVNTGTAVTIYARSVRDNRGVTYCRVYYKVPGATSYKAGEVTHHPLDLLNLDSREYTIPKEELSQGGTLAYYVEAGDAAGNKTRVPTSGDRTKVINPPKPGPFGLISPAANAPGVDPVPTFRWEAAERASSYRIELTGDLFGSPNPLHFRDDNVGNVTSWKYDGNPPLRPGSVVWWRVWAVNAVGETENTGGWRKFTVGEDHFECIATSYLPSRHGYSFDNFGGDPLISIPSLGISVPFLGRCYGMSARSVDYFVQQVSIPRNTVPTDQQQHDITRRQFDFAAEIPHVVNQLVANTLGNDTMAEDFEWLRRKLEQGAPHPILVSGPPLQYTTPWQALPPFHVVVAYKVCLNHLGRLGVHAIHVYDPNVNASEPAADEILALYDSAARSFILRSGGWSFDWFTTCRAYTPAPIRGQYFVEPPTYSKGHFRAVIRGEPHAVYRVESSEDLVNWRPRGTIQADTTGKCTLEDLEAVMPARYYRIMTN